MRTGTRTGTEMLQAHCFQAHILLGLPDSFVYLDEVSRHDISSRLETVGMTVEKASQWVGELTRRPAEWARQSWIMVLTSHQRGLGTTPEIPNPF